jgi:hypothetical protein
MILNVPRKTASIPRICAWPIDSVCQHCDSLDIDTPCDHCQATQRRFVFEGVVYGMALETEANDQGALTFKNQDAIVIAHNFEGYDDQFILNYLVHTACMKPKVILHGIKILCLEVCSLKFIDS